MRIHGGDDIFGYYSNIENHIRSAIQSREDSYILGIDEEEYINYLFDEYSLEPIIKDHLRKMTTEEASEWITDEGILGPFTRERLLIKLGYLIKINRTTSEVAELQSSLIGGIYEWELDEGSGMFRITVDRNPSAIKGAVDSLEAVLLNKNSQIESSNPQLKEKIKMMVKERIEKVKKNKSDFEEVLKTINFPLEIVNKDAVKPIDFGIKTQIKALIPPTPKPKVEYVLDREKVLTILQIIDNLVKSWETAPNSYNNRPEEDLRDIILSSLNSVFGGKATAETFSKKGKADIFLSIEENAALVMECKWWDGEKMLVEAINQILGYITWRHSFGIIIVFSKNQDFTNVLDSVKQAIQAHELYKNGMKSISNTHFESIHTFPEDDRKTIELHVVVYNLCPPK